MKRIKRNNNKPEVEKIKKKSRPRLNHTPKNSSASSNNSTNNPPPSHRPNQKTARSRTATPQPPESIQTPTSCSSQLFEHFSQSARETSPPAKVRLPSQRMTILEMNRRANQILEYICSMQVEMATSKRTKETQEEDEEDDLEELQKRRQLVDAQISEAMTKAVLELDKENKRPTPILIPGQYDPSSPSSSLSSASTLPLLEDDRIVQDHEKGIAEEALERMRKPKQEQTSLEIMDLLTRQVITFQRRFGSLCYSNSPSCLDESEESDGPVTRSRDTRTIFDRNTW